MEHPRLTQPREFLNRPGSRRAIGATALTIIISGGAYAGQAVNEAPRSIPAITNLSYQVPSSAAPASAEQQDVRAVKREASRSMIRRNLVAAAASRATQQSVESRHAPEAKATASASSTPTARSTVTAPRERSRAATSHSSYDSSLEHWLVALRDCESGGDYSTDTGNGFYGAYQFTRSTWDSLPSSVNGGYTRADEAPPSVQDEAIIYNTNHSSGLSSQNPGCYRSTGDSNYPPQ